MNRNKVKLSEAKRHCKECNSELVGRADQIFCSDYCRTSYHSKNKSKDQFVKNVTKILRKNHQILRTLNPEGLAFVRREIMVSKGFNFRYFTNYWKNKSNETYFFCYDYGYRYLKEDDKCALIKWQNYMDYNK